jgi:hypothetical protein
MKIAPQDKNKIYIKDKPIDDQYLVQQVAIAFVFVSVFGFAVKLLFF